MMVAYSFKRLVFGGSVVLGRLVFVFSVLLSGQSSWL